MLTQLAWLSLIGCIVAFQIEDVKSPPSACSWELACNVGVALALDNVKFKATCFGAGGREVAELLPASRLGAKAAAAGSAGCGSGLCQALHCPDSPERVHCRGWPPHAQPQPACSAACVHRTSQELGDDAGQGMCIAHASACLPAISVPGQKFCQSTDVQVDEHKCLV